MLPRTFFQRDPITCARELVGCELVWDSCAGLIVETEAYTATGDEAAHTFVRPSARAFVAKHEAGTAYVYFNYGMYWLFNVLIKGGREDGFVLIRALQPTRGIPAMRRRRFPVKKAAPNARPKPPEALCSGPGKLTIALGIGGEHHGTDLCTRPSNAFHGPADPAIRRLSDLRIGITKSADYPWRFLAAENPFVSVKASSSAVAC
ncbi:DNA-3-methyladenine glycosylase [Chthoniobacter flavus Ellin428]|uniref:Putative 3-methyladenine DNA glycosylase n=1 Tax=Chthoniobacter flavus Ellin428 TaxID=497964 RepID=B4CVR3_9BACT|nr:DNA-3-methyladenine glycosylase [Chthoniobacter flavus]EDY21505.1 DNA-3-methyladenine glycosylase [Chthoniobacter flavus Ellin428]TCO95456.1 DNA-3-methyladenine glycosylase [Chthoniobacter flavus]